MRRLINILIRTCTLRFRGDYKLIHVVAVVSSEVSSKWDSAWGVVRLLCLATFQELIHDVEITINVLTFLNIGILIVPFGDLVVIMHPDLCLPSRHLVLFLAVEGVLILDGLAEIDAWTAQNDDLVLPCVHLALYFFFLFGDHRLLFQDGLAY